VTRDGLAKTLCSGYLTKCMALICHCRGVTERRILKAIQRGATTAWEVEGDCGAGGGCGGCARAVDDLLEAHASASERLAGRMLSAHAG
jgi:bacterioferritin-associated ferredoxin